MSKFELRVKVKSIGETQSFDGSDFTKRDLIGIQEGEYENLFHFEFIKDKTKLLDELLPDTYVTISFNIRCREVTRKDGEIMYFTSLQGWKVEV